MSRRATQVPALARDEADVDRRIGALAIAGLRAELAVYPKPGLVSVNDSGAHRDMNAATMTRSIDSLSDYFVDIARAGAGRAPFSTLRALAVGAERRMMAATAGINTHRGAIFTLGLLAAAAGRVAADGTEATDGNLRATLCAWRSDLRAFAIDATSEPSHGRIVAARFGATGARGEAVAAFPSVFEIGLPALRHALCRTRDGADAMLHAFFALAARVDDTNVLYRGGTASLSLLRREAAAFLSSGSVFVPGWLQRAEALHRRCCALRISPGGCADLLAACAFVHQLQAHA